ncbi:Arc family DNA-binding protein [Acinetobacter pittii]|uniref:Arc family DNA-binding protein n=1 Tax=Acinetobacter pittii TaxID=48296 RepID=UPI001D09922D|nr:Arc family DNA-binding protein [Acinetobacter pittii]
MSENQKEPQYKLRWSEDLRNKITQSAKDHNRSINAEITTRLEKSFEEPTLFNSNDAEAVTKIVALSMSHLLSELSDKGVDKDILFQALQNVAKK